MNVIFAVKQYVSTMIENAGPGMKVIMMDQETTSVVSMVYAQSEILQREVFLFEKMDSPSRDSMKLLKCICFVRPTNNNILLLQKELQNPKYGQYYIYFSNILRKQDMKLLAEADESECVKDIQEVFGDYIPVSRHLFSVNQVACSQGQQWVGEKLQRCTAALSALLLSIKRNPIIRYQASSPMARKLAENVQAVMSREAGLFDFRRGGGLPPVLLIIDRRSDPFTPLLNQWTYQSMVHELLGIHNNRVNLSHVAGLSGDLQEVVMSAEHDEFYSQNMYSNFGDTANNIKRLMDEFQTQSQSHAKVESISDMKEFIEHYPQFKKMSGTVSKHVTVVSELSRLVSRHQLLKVSEIEQELVAGGDHSQCLQEIRNLINNENVRDIDKVRLVYLYGLCYERHSNNGRHALVDQLMKRGISESYKKMMGHLLDFGGTKQRGIESSDFTTSTSTVVKKLFKGLKGVENIYTQHKPQLATTIELLSKGRLKELSHPVLTGPADCTERPQEVIIFIVGGVTYEEALCVHNHNQSSSGTQVLLGGTTVHNFKSFQEEITAAAAGPPVSTRTMQF